MNSNRRGRRGRGARARLGDLPQRHGAARSFTKIHIPAPQTETATLFPLFPPRPLRLNQWRALNAKNYVGWDCEVKRQLSVGIPSMLMEELDTRGSGEDDKRTVQAAVAAVWERLQDEKPVKRAYWWYGERLRVVERDGSVFLDLNNKPF